MSDQPKHVWCPNCEETRFLGQGKEFCPVCNLWLGESKMSDHEEKSPELDELAAALEDAWCRYTQFFHEPPHGTYRQLRGMLELMPAEYRSKLMLAFMGDEVYVSVPRQDQAVPAAQDIYGSCITLRPETAHHNSRLYSSQYGRPVAIYKCRLRFESEVLQ